MRRPALLLTTLVAACNVYESSLLTGGPAAAGLGGGAATGGASAAGAGGVTPSSGGTRGGTSSAGAAGGSEPGGMGGEAGGDAEGGDAGESASGTGGGAQAGTGGAGSGGQSGGAGQAGSGGASAGSAGKGGAGQGGTAGTSGSAGAAGAETCVGATGCARLSVPLVVLNDRTHFSIALGGEVDFSNAVITYRVRKVSATGGRIWAYVQHGGTPDYNLIYGGTRNFDQLGDDFTTVTWDVAAAVPPFPFDKALIARLGIEIVATGTGPWTDPTVVVVDSIEVTGPNVGPWPFDDDSTITTAAAPPNGVLWMSDNAPAELVPGSTLGWLP